MLKRLLGVLAALLTLTFLVSCSDDGDRTADEPDTTETTESTEGTSDSPAGEPASGDCEYAEDGTTPAKKVELPPAAPEVKGKVEVTINTSAGPLKTVLDADAAPCTVNSFMSLVKQGYYDNTVCHRLVPEGIFVLQCGDAEATGDSPEDGTHGPGYTIPDEYTGKEQYTAGTLAMARTPAPNTGGSQFFIVYETNQGLAPEYTIFGKVDKAGIDAIRKVAAKGLAANGVAPKEKVTITSVK